MTHPDPHSPDEPYVYECVECGHRIETEEQPHSCPECGGDVQNISVSRER